MELDFKDKGQSGVEDSGELTKAWLKYAVNKVFQSDRYQSCWAEALHQG